MGELKSRVLRKENTVILVDWEEQSEEQLMRHS